jgi:membrane associated rhomboid family serine protease
MKKNVFVLPILFVVTIWIVFIVDMLIPLDLRTFGIVPRTVTSLPGILFSNFLHANLAHIISNTPPLFFLLLFTSIFYKDKSIDVIAVVIVVGGSLLWLAGRPSIHIGASMLIYGLAVFLILYGIFLRKIIPILLSLFVIGMYGSALLIGVLPLNPYISWEGHLCGGIGGATAAWLIHKFEP